MIPADEKSTPVVGSPTIPLLIDDYRTQHEALESKLQELLRLREQLERSAETEGREIVARARNGVRTALSQAREDLLAFTAAAQAATERLGGTADLGFVHDIVAEMKREMQSIPEEVRPELDALELAVETMSVAPTTAHRHSVTPSTAAPEPAAGRTAVEPPPHAPLGFDLAPEGAAREPQVVSPRRQGFVSEFDPGGEFAAQLGRPRQSEQKWDDRPVHAAASPAMVASSEPLFAHAPAMKSRRSTGRVLLAVGVAGLALSGAAGWWWMQVETARAEEARYTQPAARPVAVARQVAPVAEAVAPLPVPTADAATPNTPSYMTVEVRRPSWIRIVVDGREMAARLFDTGETYEVETASDVSIRAGDAGAVFVSINGGEATVMGADGRATTRRYGALNSTDEPSVAADSSETGIAAESRTVAADSGRAAGTY